MICWSTTRETLFPLVQPIDQLQTRMNRTIALAIYSYRMLHGICRGKGFTYYSLWCPVPKQNLSSLRTRTVDRIPF